MKTAYRVLLFLFCAFPFQAIAQVDQAFDDFEGTTNIPAWTEDACALDTSFDNPHLEGINTSSKVLRYQDMGGQYANVRFEMNDKFDLSINQTFSLKIYIPSSSITGNQTNQVSLKLQDGSLDQPWTTQSEIIKPVNLDEWQEVTFDFGLDNFLNLDPGSALPTQRTDFDRVVIQVNGENNTDEVIAYIDDVLLYQTPDSGAIFDQLVWSDEFDVDGAADEEKWHFQTQFPVGTSWFNGEIQHYTDRIDNAFVEGGKLKIVAKKETYTDQGVTKQYTSARLNSKFAFTYGKVEIRARLPFGPGVWPAFWTLGKNINELGAYWETQGFGTVPWPQCGEIDIMEHWGDDQNNISSAIHTTSSSGATINKGIQYVPTASTDFHVYSMVWTEEKIEFAVDGFVHYVYEPEVKDDDTWPFYLDQFLLLNVAIIPSIAPNFAESALEIDYVRIYQESAVVNQGIGESDTVAAYPNPFDDELNVFLDNATAPEVVVKLSDSDGQLISVSKHEVRDGRFTINGLNSLHSGMYIISFMIDGKLYRQKVARE